jgi:hypothetical protein
VASAFRGGDARAREGKAAGGRLRFRAAGALVREDRARHRPRDDARLLDLKRATHLVYVQTIDSQGNFVDVQQNYRSIIAPENLGWTSTCATRTGPRAASAGYFDERSGREQPTLVGQLLAGLGRQPDEGYIDYSLGVLSTTSRSTR